MGLHYAKRDDFPAANCSVLPSRPILPNDKYTSWYAFEASDKALYKEIVLVPENIIFPYFLKELFLAWCRYYYYFCFYIKLVIWPLPYWLRVGKILLYQMCIVLQCKLIKQRDIYILLQTLSCAPTYIHANAHRHVISASFDNTVGTQSKQCS